VLHADIAHEQGRHRVAADECRAILSMTVERLGECHNVRVRALYVLADALARIGEDREPAELYLKRIECTRRQGGPGSVALLSILHDALPHLDRAARAAEGEALARELGATLQSLGGGHGDMQLSAELYLARFSSMQDRLDDAETMFQSLFSRQAQASGVTLTRLHLFYAGQLARRGLFPQALEQLETVVERTGDIRAGTWRSHPDDVLLEYAALYNAWGKPEKADEYRRLRQEQIDSRMRAAGE
jgi:hypothetical protein